MGAHKNDIHTYYMYTYTHTTIYTCILTSAPGIESERHFYNHGEEVTQMVCQTIIIQMYHLQW